MSLLTSLVSYWKLDEASGNALDAHGSNHLTDNNTVGTGTGIINGGRDFERDSGQYFSIASNSDLQCGNIDFTFTAWVKVETYYESNGFVILSKDTDSPGSSRDYNLDYNGSQFRFYFNGGGGSYARTASGSTGAWQFIRAWHDSVGDTINIQVNNNAVDSRPTGGEVPNSSSAPFCIGRGSYTGFTSTWDGLIDEVGFWKRVLTSDERTSLYNSGAGLAYSGFSGGGATVTLPQLERRTRGLNRRLAA